MEPRLRLSLRFHPFAYQKAANSGITWTPPAIHGRKEPSHRFMDITDPRLQIIGQEWKARSRELADWGMERLVNRKDVWGQYTGKSGPNKALTLPQKSMRGQDMVTLDKLTRHFGSLRRNHLIGLHAQSPEEMCKWVAIDIDMHEAEGDEADLAAGRNFIAATGWWEAIQAMGYDPLLFDSNGAGGFHIWILFAQPAPMADVHAFGEKLVADWEARNLDEKPETFPKSGKLSNDKMGAWLRLPGLHHSRDHYTRVWSGEEWLDDPWLEGNEAITQILSAAPGPPPASVEENPAPPVRKTRKKPSKRRPRNTPRVCVDLDGVLAQYDGWKGDDQIGDPLPGAADFTRQLSEWAQVVIYTSRCGPGPGGKGTRDPRQSIATVRAWLEKHGMTYHEIYAGKGKPLAAAYIDDRGVSCRPQEFGAEAYASALRLAQELSR